MTSGHRYGPRHALSLPVSGALDTWFATTEGLIRKSGRSHERQLHHPAAARDGEALVPHASEWSRGSIQGCLFSAFPDSGSGWPPSAHGSDTSRHPAYDI